MKEKSSLSLSNCLAQQQEEGHALRYSVQRMRLVENTIREVRVFTIKLAYGKRRGYGKSGGKSCIKKIARVVYNGKWTYMVALLSG